MSRLVLILLLVIPFDLFAYKLTELSNVNIKSSAQSAQVIFNLTQKTIGKVKYLPKQNQLTIDFSDTKKNFLFKQINFKNTLVSDFRYEEQEKNTLRFILSLSKKITWKIQFLPEAGKKNVTVTLEMKEETKHPKLDELKENFLNLLKKMADEANDRIIAQDQWRQTHLKPKTKKEINPMPTLDLKNKMTVVIDPGHGGRDLGAKGPHGIQEKNVVLAIAKKLAAELNQIPNMQAILTRNDDYFVPLRQRMELARKGKADLFIAIHADAYFHDRASGASVYAVSKHGATSEAARWLAKRENYAELGGVELNSLKDKSAQLRSVLLDLAQTASIRDSLLLGNYLLATLESVAILHHKRVEQAPFVVLKSPDIPSVLVETGFITNPREEKRLSHPYYQTQLARALAKGILAFTKKNLPS